jgi:hypothetical protein
MNDRQKFMNGRALAAATGLGVWCIYGIKKANKIFHASRGEPLIFSGLYSTPAKISDWLESHPDFIARHVLAPQRSAVPASLRPAVMPAPHARPAHRAA